MPANPRPSVWFNFDPAWNGSSRYERRQAQDIWDLLEAQEQANKIAKQQLEQERINKNIINDSVDYEADIAEYEEWLEKHRKHKAERYGIEYSVLYLFYHKIVGEQLRNKETISEFNKGLKKAKKKLKEAELDIEITSTVTKLEKELEQLRKESFIKYLMNVNRINRQIYRTKLKWGKDADVIIQDEELYQEIKQLCRKNQKEAKEEIKRIEKAINDRQNNDYSECNKLIKEFNQFRLSHYNTDFEKFFAEEFELPSTLKIDTTKITGEGNSEEYNKYMMKVLS